MRARIRGEESEQTGCVRHTERERGVTEEEEEEEEEEEGTSKQGSLFGFCFGECIFFSSVS